MIIGNIISLIITMIFNFHDFISSTNFNKININQPTIISKNTIFKYQHSLTYLTLYQILE